MLELLSSNCFVLADCHLLKLREIQIPACVYFLYLLQTQEAERHSWEIWNGDLESFGFQKKTDGAQVVAKEDVQMNKDETSRIASHTEEILSQERAIPEESSTDSTDHLEEKNLSGRQAGDRGNSWLDSASPVELLGSAKERRKLIETKILSKVILKPSPGHPELDAKPPSHGISHSLERIAKEETSSDDRLQELTHSSLQVSGPNKKFWGVLLMG